MIHIASPGLKPEDSRLATELVMGCLRRRPQLDWLIQHFSGRDPLKLSPAVRNILRLGIYQLRYLDRIPAHAAVHESVELTRMGGVGAAAGLVNAVMRKVNRDAIAWPDEATELCLPDWLLDKWRVDFGAERARSVALSLLETPVTYLRIPPGSEGAAQNFEMQIEATEQPGCYRLVQGEPGPYRIQDIGSQAIVPLLELKPGQSYLDVCAAPGNKTAQALESLGQSARSAIACDVSLARMETLNRLGCRWVAADATKPLPFRKRFDRILVDAPCSGTGTIRRNPEIKWRVSRKDLTVHSERQRSILRNALDLLAPGGRLVYSTCSLEREEGEQVVEAIRATGARVLSASRRWPGAQPGDGFFAAVLTSE